MDQARRCSGDGGPCAASGADPKQEDYRTLRMAWVWVRTRVEKLVASFGVSPWYERWKWSRHRRT